jgi:hypothetical protein
MTIEARADGVSAEERRTAREQVLLAHSADPRVAIDVLAYTQPLVPRAGRLNRSPAFHDEPHVPVWIEYARESRKHGALPTLRDRFPQLRFPIAPGVSRTESYRAATRRGVMPDVRGRPWR